MRQSILPAGLAAALCLTVLAACAAPPSDGTETTGVQRILTDGSGPLGASPGDIGDSGSISVHAPRGEDQWQATFGSMILCSRTEVPIAIRDVSVEDSTGERPTFSAHVRSMRPNGAPIDGEASPVGSAIGPPEGLGLRGALVPTSGFEVSHSCAYDPTNYDELIVTFGVGDRGVHAAKVSIDYEVEGRRERTVIPWEFTACGTSVEDETLCS